MPGSDTSNAPRFAAIDGAGDAPTHSSPDEVTSISLDGISTQINGRHAFIHERLLELIEQETERHGYLTFTKRQMADLLGCSLQSLNRAITRLRREEKIETVARYEKNGGQLGNWYRASQR